jgi:hypothetical protein
MSWVTEHCGCAEDYYNTCRSAFRRVIRAVVSRLRIAKVDDNEDPWSSRLVWSNLYKIAPCDGGNPNSKLQKAQRDGCVRLLEWELQQYHPRRILFLTGWWADPFLKGAWEYREKPIAHFFVEAVGRLKCGPHIATCVVASHPQGKNETDWENEVVNAFEYVSAS